MIGFFIYSQTFPSPNIFKSYLYREENGYGVLCDKLLKKDYKLPFSSILICVNVLSSKLHLEGAPKKELGNYSKNKKEFTAYINLLHSEFISLPDKERKYFIVNSILNILSLIRKRLISNKMYSDNYEHLIYDIEKVNQIFIESPEIIIDTSISKEDQELFDLLNEMEGG